MASPFEILRVDPDADESEIVRAYRQRVKETHPDHGGSVSEFQAVRAAYEAIVSGNGSEQALTAGQYASDGTPEQRADETRSEPADDEPTDEAQEDEKPEGVRVEYVNYEVLDDHGWSIDDEDLFDKLATADVGEADYGELFVGPDQTLLQAAEDRGFAWPYACRGGACANCAVAVTEGDLSMPVDHILPSHMTDRGIRLSCVGKPTTEETRVIFNVKHLPGLDELRLPPRPFEQAHVD